MKATFGERLQAIREAKALTLPELSRRSKLGVGTLFRYQKLAHPGAVTYDALVRLANGLEVDMRYLTGEDPLLLPLDPSQVAARESLKRFLEQVAVSYRLRRGFIRIQDDPAAPRSIQQWKNFWRLLQQFTGQSGPKKSTQAANQRNGRKPVLRVLPSRTTGKPSHEDMTRPLRFGSG
jgi:transcriptional regulator with XRE-family HTH domain